MARRTELDVIYNNQSISNNIAEYMEGFSYTDCATDTSDTISIDIYNMNKTWLDQMLPRKGDRVSASIHMLDWNNDNVTRTFHCGDFVLDDISFSGRPLKGTIGCVSLPANEDFKTTNRTKTWAAISIKEIAAEIASRAGITLYYEGPDIIIKSLEQSEQPDSSFLQNLCNSYGLAMKIYANKIVIYDESLYEAKDAVVLIDETDMINWSYNSTINGTYTGAKISYTNPDSEETIEVQVGDGNRIYSVSTKADSQYDAELKAAAAVNRANKSAETMSVKVPAIPYLAAGNCVNITGLYNLNGKYFIDKVKHNISSGYTMSLELHKIQQRITAVSKVAAMNATDTEYEDYIVKSGDTLWMLAQSRYGQGTKYTVIYDANAEVIESTAKAHGFTSSDHGHWIFPGEKLKIPKNI